MKKDYLETFTKIKVTDQDFIEKEDYEIVEKALKRLKKFDKKYEEFKEMGLDFIIKLYEHDIVIGILCKTLKDATKNTAKYKETLTIIKEKRVDLCILTDCDNVNEYNISLGNLRPVEDRLTYDEFVLLKEWLNGNTL